MAHAPECLKERFKAADELVQELNESKCINENCSIEEPGVRLMCQLWDILKDNPHLNLTELVKEQTKKLQKHSLSIPLNVNLNLPCYSNDSSDVTCACSADVCSCSSASCCSLKAPRRSPPPDSAPLTKAIYNINEAASIGQKCGDEIKTLLKVQKELETEVKMLEDKEKEVVETLKRTESMWMRMEEAYKKKIDEALAKQEMQMKNLKEAEASKVKWKKHLKDLELEVANVDKCHKEIQEKTKEKTNDLRSLKTEVNNFKKQVANTKKDLESTRKLAENKKKSSDKKLASIAAQVKNLEKCLGDERRRKHEKESEGNRAIKEARDELHCLSNILLKNKLENGDMIQEKQILIAEMDTLNQMASQCLNKCCGREQSIDDEIAHVDHEIAKFRTKFVKCHECTHTLDIKSYCMECPRCMQEGLIDCCSSDRLDCVCMYVKEKFMSNILENISTVLKKHSQTESGVAVAESVLDNLKRSTNGKLDNETRRKLQDSIVSAIKKNLNDSIVGGAVKTRCELDDKIYNQLMRCLREVQVDLLPSPDGDNKVGYPRFNEQCNSCADECVCPPVSRDEQQNIPQIYAGISSKTRARSSSADDEVVLWKTEPCDGGSCKTLGSVRAVQCGLGPQVLTRDTIAQPLRCDDCQVYSNTSSSATGPNVRLSSSNKDIQSVKSSIPDKNKSVDLSSRGHDTAPKSLNDLTSKAIKTAGNKVNFDDKSLYSLKSQICNVDSLFVIKKTDVGDYEMIVNKEFESVITKNLKEHTLVKNNNKEYRFEFKESSSGHRIVEIEPKRDNNDHQRDAVIIRTSSGTLRLFSAESHLEYHRSHPNVNYTIVTKEDFVNMLEKFQSRFNKDTKTKGIQTSTWWSIQSKSDSNVYQTTKINSNNEPCYMEIHELLTKTSSGNYIITLNKISCKTHLMEPTKKNYAKIPITFNKGVMLKNRIKVTECKCAHIFVNKNEIHDIVGRYSKVTIKYDSKENIHICKGVQSENILANTTKSQSQDTSIGSIYQGMKKFVEKSMSYRECCRNCRILNGNKIDQNKETWSHIFKRIRKNSPKYNTEGLRHDCNIVDKRCCSCNTNINLRDHERQRRNFLLKSFENLPPQLPPFLKEYNLKVA